VEKRKISPLPGLKLRPFAHLSRSQSLYQLRKWNTYFMRNTFFFLASLGLKFYKTERTCQNCYAMRTSPNLFNLDIRIRADVRLMPSRSPHTLLLFETEVHIRSKQSLLRTSVPYFPKQFKLAATSTRFRLERSKSVHQFFRFHAIDTLMICSFWN
jgi:hypothetical protein